MRVTAIAFTVLLAGCSFMKRPPNQFYALDTIAGTRSAAATGAPIGVEGIELPPGLDQRGIVVMNADHKVEVRGTNQWTSPLEEMVIHTLAFNLASRLPDGMVVLPGQGKPAAAMRSIYVNFEELAPGPEPVFVLDARWSVGLSAASRHERITIPMTSLESPAVVDAMSQALAQLADRIVAGL